jgi:hypothetical protein
MERFMIPTIGRIVHLRISAECAKSINKRRFDAKESEIAATNSGAIIHHGNLVLENDVYPLLITKIWSDKPTESTPINGQIFLDGNDSFWVTSVQQGDGPNKWFEPPRV